jgi:hypothetical protein
VLFAYMDPAEGSRLVQAFLGGAALIVLVMAAVVIAVVLLRRH